MCVGESERDSVSGEKEKDRARGRKSGKKRMCKGGERDREG